MARERRSCADDRPGGVRIRGPLRSGSLCGGRMSVEVVTFGCRLNTYESEVIRNAATSAGLENTVVVNTCAVTAEAVRQARQAIRRLARERVGVKIVVTGCAAQTEPQTFVNMAEVAIVLGNDRKLDAKLWEDQRD